MFDRNMTRPRRSGPTGKSKESMPLRTALSRRTKAELIDFLLELAEADRGILRQLTANFDVAPSPAELVARTREAIADATAFDVRDINRNFAYDYAAYDEVKRNLGRLVKAGQLPATMELALELMKRASHQVKMSDEGLMTQDIEDCLGVVLDALSKCNLPAHKVIAWCSAMLKSDRVGCIGTGELELLQSQFQTAAARKFRKD
jgi:hypothetical protein